MNKNVGMFKRAKRVYSKIAKSLLPEHEGEIIAIEPVSANYIIGPDEVEVAVKCRHLYPGKKFGLFRIGSPVVHKLR